MGFLAVVVLLWFDFAGSDFGFRKEGAEAIPDRIIPNWLPMDYKL